MKTWLCPFVRLSFFFSWIYKTRTTYWCVLTYKWSFNPSLLYWPYPSWNPTAILKQFQMVIVYHIARRKHWQCLLQKHLNGVTDAFLSAKCVFSRVERLQTLNENTHCTHCCLDRMAPPPPLLCSPCFLFHLAGGDWVLLISNHFKGHERDDCGRGCGL